MTRFVLPSFFQSMWPYSCEYVTQPKAWTELQAGVECLTQLVLLIESMLSSDDPSVVETAELLQVQIVYNGEVLDISFDSLKAYKGGVQSLTYLESSVNLAYVLLRRLEKYSKQEGESYVRKKTKKSRGARTHGLVNSP